MRAAIAARKRARARASRARHRTRVSGGVGLPVWRAPATHHHAPPRPPRSRPPAPLQRLTVSSLEAYSCGWTEDDLKREISRATTSVPTAPRVDAAALPVLLVWLTARAHVAATGAADVAVRWAATPAVSPETEVGEGGAWGEGARARPARGRRPAPPPPPGRLLGLRRPHRGRLLRPAPGVVRPRPPRARTGRRGRTACCRPRTSRSWRASCTPRWMRWRRPGGRRGRGAGRGGGEGASFVALRG